MGRSTRRGHWASKTGGSSQVPLVQANCVFEWVGGRSDRSSGKDAYSSKSQRCAGTRHYYKRVREGAPVTQAWPTIEDVKQPWLRTGYCVHTSRNVESMLFDRLACRARAETLPSQETCPRLTVRSAVASAEYSGRTSLARRRSRRMIRPSGSYSPSGVCQRISIFKACHQSFSSQAPQMKRRPLAVQRPTRT